MHSFKNAMFFSSRYFHSFRGGILPKLEGGTLHKLLKQCAYIITAVDGRCLFIRSPLKNLFTQKSWFHPAPTSSRMNLLLMRNVELPTANGNEIRGNLTVTLGGMMFFEAKPAHSGGSSGIGRMYIHRCFLTTSRQPDSGPKYDVIDKGGYVFII